MLKYNALTPAELLVSAIDHHNPQHLFIGDSQHELFDNLFSTLRDPLFTDALQRKKYDDLNLEITPTSAEMLLNAFRSSKKELAKFKDPKDKAYTQLAFQYLATGINVKGIDIHQEEMKNHREQGIFDTIQRATITRLDMGGPLNNGWDKKLSELWGILSTYEMTVEGRGAADAAKSFTARLCIEKENISNPYRIRSSFDLQAAQQIDKDAQTMTVFGSAHMDLFKNMPSSKLDIIYCVNTKVLHHITALHMIKGELPTYYLDAQNVRLLRGEEWHEANRDYRTVANLIHGLG